MWRRRRSPRPPRRRHPTGRGLVERVLFSFMGPPQLGDPNAPRLVPPDPAAALCRKCGQPWEDHEIVRTASLTYASCPSSPREA